MILEVTWKIVDTRVSVCQYPARDQGLIPRQGCQIIKILKVERWYLIDMARGDKKASSNLFLPPDRIIIDQIKEERVTLYHQVPTPGDNTPILVAPFMI